MDRTRNAVERMLAALDAPAYDLGILSERGMLPGLSDLTAANVLSRLSLLRAHNARGAHIYIRPAGRAPLHCSRRPQSGFRKPAGRRWP